MRFLITTKPCETDARKAATKPFDAALYNGQATIAGNLLFGVAVSPDYAPENLAHNRVVRALLAEMELETPLFALGRGGFRIQP